MANVNRGAGDIVMDSGDFMADDLEENFGTGTFTEGDTIFDSTIGHIEDIIMDQEFQTMQQDFLEKYYTEFEDTEENKFIYTDIHKEYIEVIEKYLEEQLKERMESFSMETFQAQLVARKEELEGEIFEMLMTFSDFMAFKEMVLDYRGDKEGSNIDFTDGLLVTSLGPEPPVSASNGLSVGGLGVGGQSVSPGLSVGGQAVNPGLSVGGQALNQGLSVSGQSVSPGQSRVSPTIPSPSTTSPYSFLTPLPSQEPDMTRLQSSKEKPDERVEAAMSMSPGQSLEEGATS